MSSPRPLRSLLPGPPHVGSAKGLLQRQQTIRPDPHLIHRHVACPYYLCPMMKQWVCLLLLLGLGMVGRTQSLLLEYNQQPLNNQSVIVRSGTPDSLDMTTWLTITNRSSDTVMVMAKKEMILQVPGASGSICWGGYCYPPEINVSLYPLKLNPGECVTGCFAHFSQQGSMGTSTLRWTYFPRDAPEDSVCVTIHYLLWPAGNEPLTYPSGSFSLPYPNPAGRQMNIRRMGSVDGNITVSLFDPAGCLVSRNHLPAGTSVLSVDTGNLPAGIYFYSLELGPLTVSRGEFMIRH